MSKHLTLSDRAIIERYIVLDMSFAYIAKRLHRSATTISREVKNHRCFVNTVRYSSNDCINYRTCLRRNLCSTESKYTCFSRCKTCTEYSCSDLCHDYISAHCPALDNIDYEDKHYKIRKADLENRLSKTYDKIEETENALVEAKAKKRSILAEKVCGDNIYKALIFFDKMYEPMNEAERREFLTQFIEKVEIYEEEQENGQWLKSIEFKLPIISKDMKISLDNGSQIETVCLLSKLHEAKHHINVKVDMDELDLTSAEAKATYKEIEEWVQEHYGFHVTNLNIAQVKQKHGIIERENYNKPKSENSRQPGCPEEKVKAIEDAMRHFQMI